MSQPQEKWNNKSTVAFHPEIKKRISNCALITFRDSFCRCGLASTFNQNPNLLFVLLPFSLYISLITSLFDTDMEDELLSMLKDIIDCSMCTTIKAKYHSVLQTCVVYKMSLLDLDFRFLTMHAS